MWCIKDALIYGETIQIRHIRITVKEYNVWDYILWVGIDHNHHLHMLCEYYSNPVAHSSTQHCTDDVGKVEGLSLTLFQNNNIINGDPTHSLSVNIR